MLHYVRCPCENVRVGEWYCILIILYVCCNWYELPGYKVNCEFDGVVVVACVIRVVVCNSRSGEISRDSYPIASRASRSGEEDGF